MTRQENSTDWQPCVPGELQSMAGTIRARQRREHLTRTVSKGAWGLLVVAAAVFLAGLSLSDRPLIGPGGITCQACQAEFAPYHAHLSGRDAMDQQLVEQMQVHLEHCKICAGIFEDTYPGVLSGQAVRSGWPTHTLAMSW